MPACTVQISSIDTQLVESRIVLLRSPKRCVFPNTTISRRVGLCGRITIRHFIVCMGECCRATGTQRATRGAAPRTTTTTLGGEYNGGNINTLADVTIDLETPVTVTPRHDRQISRHERGRRDATDE